MSGKNRRRMETAKLIRAKREKKGMSRKELGGILGCSGQTIWLWESGRTRPLIISRQGIRV